MKNTTTPDSKKLAQLMAAPFFEKIIAESEAELAATRQEHVAEIGRLNALQVAQVPGYDDDIEAARRDVAALEKQLAAAQAALGDAVCRRGNFLWGLDHARQLHTAELLKTAPDLIDDFIAEMFDLLETYHGKIGNRVRIDDKGTMNSLARIEVFSTTYPAANRWYAAVLLAIREAEVMKLESEISTFPERLAALRAALPDPMHLEMTKYEVHPPVFRKG